MGNAGSQCRVPRGPHNGNNKKLHQTASDWDRSEGLEGLARPGWGVVELP